MTQQRISDDEIAVLLEKRDGDDANDMWAAKGAIEKSSDKLIRDLQDARALLVQKDAEIAALKAENTELRQRVMIGERRKVGP